MLEVFLILCLTSLACGILGNLLVLKNESMIIDALSHSVLLGIVLGFFISKNLHSIYLIIGASLFGVLTVFLIDFFQHSHKINHDSATGLVFPFFFSIAVILISMYAKNTHLDIDMVLMGEILFAPLDRIPFWGISLPIAFVQLFFVLIINIVFLSVFYHRIKLYLFDSTQAHISGISILTYKIISMFLIALTTLISFNAVGSITVVSFFIAPSLSALLFSKNLKQLLYLSSLFSILIATVGFISALLFDLNISGSTSFISLIIVLITIIFKNY